MKQIISILTLALLPYFLSAQIINGAGEKIDTSKVRPWTPEKIADYQSLYGFGFSELESYFLLIVTNESCYAQIKDGEFNEDATDFIWNYENLKNVRIDGNKFYSDKTNGEFVIYGNKKGLIIYDPWRSVAQSGESEIGFIGASLSNFIAGKFTYASFKLLSKDELRKMTISDLKIMRNEIYARYGYIFKTNGEMDNYFSAQSWYRGQHENVSDFLTGLEWENIELIQIIESEKNDI